MYRGQLGNLVPRALALPLPIGTRNEAPLDKGNAGSGNEIAWKENTGIYIMNKGHVKASIFIGEKGNQPRCPGLK